ncbi:MAG: hypothetical protein MZV70_29730 [Desulfobacterales bacterium]|nr:hypothetical protein [Desulfobacterales bacterium]
MRHGRIAGKAAHPQEQADEAVHDQVHARHGPRGAWISRGDEGVLAHAAQRI